MLSFRLKRVIQAILVMFFVTTICEIVASNEAFARAGKGRSSGRSFGYSRPAGGGYGSSYNRNMNQPSQRGSFMRGLAGGLAGGFLGSMLFSSFGHASGLGSNAGGGGFGMLEILLLAGLGFFLFRWWRQRQAQNMAYSSPAQVQPIHQSGSYAPPAWQQHTALPVAGIDSEQASDLFFRVQGAWTRRDLAPIRSLLGSEIESSLAADIDDLKRRGQINRLENITVRQTEIVDSWQEGNIDYSRVRFVANLLDYTTDERSGHVVEGSDSVPVKFEENWVFGRFGNGWQLVAIEQI